MRVLSGLSTLTTTFQACIDVLGSENTYTSSTAFAMFERLWEASVPMLACDDLKPIGIALQNSLLERHATHYFAQSYFDPAVHDKVGGGKVALWDPWYACTTFWPSESVQPTVLKLDGKALEERLGRDARHLSAMVLDPAAFHLVNTRVPGPDGAWKGDVVAYLYQQILVPGAEIVGAAPVPAAAPGPANPQSLQSKINAIKASKPPVPTMSKEMWAAEQARQIEAAKEVHRAKGDLGAVVGAGGAGDPYSPLLDALRLEVDAHALVLKAAFEASMPVGRVVSWRDVCSARSSSYYWPPLLAHSRLTSLRTATSSPRGPARAVNTGRKRRTSSHCSTTARHSFSLATPTRRATASVCIHLLAASRASSVRACSLITLSGLRSRTSSYASQLWKTSRAAVPK